MNQYRVRVFMSTSFYQDMVLQGDTCWIAEGLGKGMSPIGRAIFLNQV